jgi:hypothetical protein
MRICVRCCICEQSRSLIDVCNFLLLVRIVIDNRIIKKRGGETEITTEKSKNNNDYYIAVDIRKKNCVVCITSQDGSIIEETNYDNKLLYIR